MDGSRFVTYYGLIFTATVLHNLLHSIRNLHEHSSSQTTPNLIELPFTTLNIDIILEITISSIPIFLAIANQLLANLHSSLHRSRIDIVIMTPLSIPPFLSIAHSSNCMYTDTHGKHSNKSNDLRTQKRIVCATRWPSRVPRVENKRRFPQTESTQYPESSLHSLISTSTSAEQWYSLLRISRREYSGSNGSSAISLPSLVSDPYIQTTPLHYRASIQRSQEKQLLQRSYERIARRSLQIVKPQYVLDPHRFQLHSIESSATHLENHAAQIAWLDFANGVFRKQSKALRPTICELYLPCTFTTRSSRSLPRM